MAKQAVSWADVERCSVQACCRHFLFCLAMFQRVASERLWARIPRVVLGAVVVEEAVCKCLRTTGLRRMVGLRMFARAVGISNLHMSTFANTCGICSVGACWYSLADTTSECVNIVEDIGDASLRLHIQHV